MKKNMTKLAMVFTVALAVGPLANAVVLQAAVVDKPALALDAAMDGAKQEAGAAPKVVKAIDVQGADRNSLEQATTAINIKNGVLVKRAALDSLVVPGTFGSNPYENYMVYGGDANLGYVTNFGFEYIQYNAPIWIAPGLYCRFERWVEGAGIPFDVLGREDDGRMKVRFKQ